jgi:hypothetical protein
MTSRYVQRCEDCGSVRGMTAFRVLGLGERSPVCRWCEERDRNVRRDVRDRAARVQRLVRQEGELLAKLKETRDRLSRARHALTARIDPEQRASA